MNNVFCITSGKPLDFVQLHKFNKPNVNEFNEELIFDNLRARFGDSQPIGGVVNTNSVKVTKSTIYIDTYGRGNVHNSIWQYKPKGFKDKKDWNRPMPFPSSIKTLKKVIEENKGKSFTLGYKSDPFMWMDMKYGITKEFLRLANINDINLTIETMSDLIGHDDYLNLLDGNYCEVVMNMGGGVSDEQERLDSPGAPSILRRVKVVDKLKSAGIKVKYRVKGKLTDIFNYSDSQKVSNL